MKSVISATLFFAITIGGSSVFSQQSTAQKPKSDRAKNQSSSTTSTAEPGQDANQTDANSVVASGVEAQKHYDSAVALADEGRFADAIDAFKQSLRFRPDDPQTNYTLGLAYAKSQSYKDAYESFKRVTRLKPDWPEGHFQLGTMSYVLGKRDQAQDEYKKLVQLNSSLASVLYRVINENVLSTTAGERVTATLETSPAPVRGSSSPSSSQIKPAADKSSNIAKPSSAETTKSSETLLTEIYRVGVGDVLDIRLLNSAPGRSTLFTVIAGGLIDLPVAGGQMIVGGLTVDEIQKRISTELKRRAVNDGTQVSVGVRQYASHSVVVTGFVVNPGTKFLRREAVPLYVILAEAQLRNDAGRVVILRSGSSAFDLKLSDPTSMNVNVLTGDLIAVSGKEQEFYYIAGRVTYPGQKAFQPGITLLQAILAAGGTRPPNQNNVEISREGADSRLVTTRFKVKDIKAGRAEDPKLQPGDRIEVIP